VVLPDGDTRKIQNHDDLAGDTYLNIDLVFYTKIALSYAEGMDNKYTLFTYIGSNKNGLILDAAQYAIHNNP